MEKQSLSVKTIFEEAIEIDSPPDRSGLFGPGVCRKSTNCGKGLKHS